MAITRLFREITFAQEKEESTKLLTASRYNTLHTIKKCLRNGADINFTINAELFFNNLIINSFDYKKSGLTNALIIALRYGCYDSAKLLIRKGTTLSFKRSEGYEYGAVKQKAIDFLITPTPHTHDGRRIHRPEFSKFTPKQQTTLMGLMIKHCADVTQLCSDQTMDNCIHFGADYLLPMFYKIGFPFHDHHFVDAANPFYKPTHALPMLKALRPYFRDVNITNGAYNAGHVTQATHDKDSYAWLKDQGLDISAPHRFPPNIF